MKTYVGERSAYGVRVAVLEEEKRPRALVPRNDIRCHWPDGFEWGYVGFGPAQPALALLVDHSEDERGSLKSYQDFTKEVVADLPFWGWEMKPTALDRSGEKDTGLDESGHLKPRATPESIKMPSMPCCRIDPRLHSTSTHLGLHQWCSSPSP